MDASRGPRTQVSSTPRRKDARAALAVEAGREVGRWVELTGSRATIGRDPQATVVLDDDEVSRFHAELRLGEDGWSVLDLHSTNGTRVNDQVVDAARLEHGDRITIGGHVLRFLLEVERTEHVFRVQ